MTEQSYGPIPLTARLFSVLPLKIIASTQKCEKKSPSQPMRIFPATEPKPGNPIHDFLIPVHSGLGLSAGTRGRGIEIWSVNF